MNYLLHCWNSTRAGCSYLRYKLFEKTTLAAIFGGAPMMYAAPDRFWQGFVAVGVVILTLMPDPPKEGGDAGNS